MFVCMYVQYEDITGGKVVIDYSGEKKKPIKPKAAMIGCTTNIRMNQERGKRK